MAIFTVYLLYDIYLCWTCWYTWGPIDSVVLIPLEIAVYPPSRIVFCSFLRSRMKIRMIRWCFVVSTCPQHIRQLELEVPSQWRQDIKNAEAPTTVLLNYVESPTIGWYSVYQVIFTHIYLSIYLSVCLSISSYRIWSSLSNLSKLSNLSNLSNLSIDPSIHIYRPKTKPG